MHSDGKYGNGGGRRHDNRRNQARECDARSHSGNGQARQPPTPPTPTDSGVPGYAVEPTPKRQPRSSRCTRHRNHSRAGCSIRRRADVTPPPTDECASKPDRATDQDNHAAAYSRSRCGHSRCGRPTEVRVRHAQARNASRTGRNHPSSQTPNCTAKNDYRAANAPAEAPASHPRVAHHALPYLACSNSTTASTPAATRVGAHACVAKICARKSIRVQ